MLKWIGKVLGGASASVAEGVPAQWASRLEKLLASIDRLGGNKIRSGLGESIRDYVLGGDSPSVLHEVSQHSEIGQYLRLIGYHYGDNDPKFPDLYEEFSAVPPLVALRWARVLEACVSNQQSACKIQLPNGVHWPEVLLLASARHSINGWSSQRPKTRHLSAASIEALLLEADMDPAALLTGAFGTSVTSGYGVEQRLMMVTDLGGYPEMLDRHLEAIRPLMLPSTVAQRLHVMNMLASAAPSSLDRLASELCEMATASSKQVRAAAEPLIRRASKIARTPLRDIAVLGKPEQRVHALRLLAMLAVEVQDEESLAFARTTALADKAPSVQALIGEWDAAESLPSASSSHAYAYSLPVIDWSPTANALPPQWLDSFWQEVNDSIVKSNKQAREHHERMQAQGHKFRLHQESPFDGGQVRALRDYLAAGQHKPPGTSKSQTAFRHVGPVLVKRSVSEGVTPVALLKLLLFFDLAVANDGMLMYQAAAAFNAMHRRTGRPTLLELSMMLDELGYSGAALLRNYCHGWGQSIATDWANDAVWPYFAHYVDLLAQTLTQNLIKDYAFNRNGLFRAVSTLPSPPNNVINALFSLALGSGKTDRYPAQEALQNFAGKEARIINALADGKSDARAAAASWLGRLRHAEAIPSLEQAVAKEKHDLAKGAMLDALQLMGQAVEKYLNRDALASEAAKSLSRGLPKDLEWFPWSALPEVRWDDSRAQVPSDVLRWMLVQAVKQKSPEPNAVLRKYCSMFDPRDRENFGQFVLETWLREDVRPIDPEEAMTRARNQAQSTHQYMTRSPQYFQDNPNFGKSVEELTAVFLPGFLRLPRGSAINSKGLLAVAAACAAERAAAPTQRYLKEWYGSRAGQGKALIAMLAWIEHPSATQIMLAIGSRFRTKSFQEEATRQAEALADRKGWSLAELADRTVPSAGFDESGELSLCYGERSFKARLLPDFSVELFNPDGKKIAALPEPRQDDDADLAKEAKKAFSAAKKEIKSIVNLQTERLYEALCTEREWSFADWKAYLLQHPVLRHLVQRLVWAKVSDGRTEQTFRPLDDGTLTDREDNEVEIADESRIRLAHDSLLDPDEVKCWQQHLVDYEIRPLFQQLGKGTYSLPAAQANTDEIKDFEGYLLEAFSLRGRALKLGYTRGAAEDGGWFHVYEKRFPTLGLVAVIEFTGNPLPEENRTVALLNLSFSASGGESWQRGKLHLTKVPKVLLSECYNDLRLIAAEGSGYDPQWQKKSEY